MQNYQKGFPWNEVSQKKKNFYYETAYQAKSTAANLDSRDKTF
jgi:hypothetical protein